MSRFDYIRYDDESNARQEQLKKAVSAVESGVDQIGSTLKPVVPKDGKEAQAMTGQIKTRIMVDWYKEKALSALEVSYMWMGKAIREEQIARHDKPQPLQEERKNG